MDSISDKELRQIARLVEVTSDAVAFCQGDGTILHVNHQLLTLLGVSREAVVGHDVKDFLFSEDFERASHHHMPFSLDGSDNDLMLKLKDGSFIHVRARAIGIFSKSLLSGGKRSQRVLVALRSLEEQVAHDRQTQRLLQELRMANKRLSGTLSVIMATVGAEDMSALLDTVLNKLTDTLDAGGATIYFSENGGFKLRGISHSLEHREVPDFVPYGAGVATYVLREGRSCRMSVAPAASSDAAPLGSGVYYDIDSRVSGTLRAQDMPPFKTLIAVPVFFGTQVLGIVELGWFRPTTPRHNDARVLEVICDYLSIELVGLVSSLRSQRQDELNRSLNHVRDALFSMEGDHIAAWREVAAELKRALSCRLCPVIYDRVRGAYAIEFDNRVRVDLPGSVDEVFFSTTAPASRAQADLVRDGVPGGPSVSANAPELKMVRLVRVDRATSMGQWLFERGLPCHGAFLDMGPDAWGVSADGTAIGDGSAAGQSLDRGDAGTHSGHPAQPDDAGVPESPAEPDAAGVPASPAGPSAGATALATAASSAPRRMFLLLRAGSQEPIDDIEYDYLLHMAHDYELASTGRHAHEADHRIAQTLQAGMRNSLGSVPGITASSLYSSATRQALVGGDFYTLIRLPDERAVMILGDVSGKGIEAASMSALVKTALSAYAWEGASPAAMARSLNSMLMGFSRVETFATMFIAKIDLRRHRADYCSAGHPPTMLVHPARGDRSAEVELLSVQSGVVGAFEGMGYDGGSFNFSEGDMLFMYTDGAIEARNATGAFFGEQRLRDEVLKASAGSVKGLCAQVLRRLDEFTDSTLDDDIALVALRFGDPAGKEIP